MKTVVQRLLAKLAPSSGQEKTQADQPATNVEKPNGEDQTQGCTIPVSQTEPKQLVPLSTDELARLITVQLSDAAAAQELFLRLREDDIFLLKNHFYRPFVNPKSLPEGFKEKTSQLFGIEIDAEKWMSFAEKEFPQYLQEFRAKFPLKSPSPEYDDFFLINGFYMAVDAHVYYSMIRRLKPRRIIEVGAGQSSLLAREAVGLNRAGGAPCDYTLVEPFPSKVVRNKLKGEAEFNWQKVENLPFDFFSVLEEGDFLFIDSTHALRAGGDVQYLYCEILPRLNPGVFVHIHDISLPREYPACYFDYGYFWNEQYLLQAYLTNNSKIEVVWPGNYLFCHLRERMLTLFPEIKDMQAVFEQSEPSAFWFRTR